MPLTLPLFSRYVVTFCVFFSFPDLLALLRPTPRGRQSIALLAPIVVNCGEYANATFRVNLRFVS